MRFLLAAFVLTFVAVNAQLSFDFSTNSTRLVPPDVVKAVRYAGSLIPVTFPTTVKVQVYWRNLGGTMLGYSQNTMHRNSTHNMCNALYVARGGTVNSGETTSDITLHLDSSYQNWYLGTDCRPSKNEYDLATVILHEMIHGLGMQSLIYSLDSGANFLNENSPDDQLSVYDSYLVCKSSNLTRCFKGGGIYFQLHDGGLVSLYSPPVWTTSSVVHLNPAVFAAGGEDGLMVPALTLGTCHHRVGPVVTEILRTLGYSIKALPPLTSVPPESTQEPSCAVMTSTPWLLLLGLWMMRESVSI